MECVGSERYETGRCERSLEGSGVECVPPNATLQEAARKMRDLDIGPLPVCGDNDRLVGILTDSDLLRCLIDLLAHGG